MTVTDVDMPPGDEEPDGEDPAFVELLERLRPVFSELVKVSVEAAIDAVPTPTFKPGQVTNVNVSTGIATVIIDGDTAPIAAQVICELPGVGDRVFVEFVPPATALVIGIVNGTSDAGMIGFFAGPITGDGLGQDGAGFVPPRGWLRAKGGLYLAEQYPALYARIGTAHNTGGESTNPVQFRVPNLDDRFIIASGSAYPTLGAVGGAATHTIAAGNLPPHTHDLGSHTHDLGGHTHNHTPTGSINTSGLGTSDPGTHTHSYGPQGTSGGFGLVDSATASSSGTVSTGPGGAHTHTITGSATFTGTQTPTTGPSTNATSGPSTNSSGNGPGASTAINHLPPYIVLHACIKT